MDEHKKKAQTQNLQKKSQIPFNLLAVILVYQNAKLNAPLQKGIFKLIKIQFKNLELFQKWNVPFINSNLTQCFYSVLG